MGGRERSAPFYQALSQDIFGPSNEIEILLLGQAHHVLGRELGVDDRVGVGCPVVTVVTDKRHVRGIGRLEKLHVFLCEPVTPVSIGLLSDHL